MLTWPKLENVVKIYAHLVHFAGPVTRSYVRSYIDFKERLNGFTNSLSFIAMHSYIHMYVAIVTKMFCIW